MAEGVRMRSTRRHDEDVHSLGYNDYMGSRTSTRNNLSCTLVRVVLDHDETCILAGLTGMVRILW